MENIDKLAAALAAAQGRIQPAPKDQENPYFKSHYASLPSIREAMREAFADNGLSVVQIPDTTGPVIRLRTILLHASGQSLDCGCLETDIGEKGTIQSMGAALTYFRRYALAAISQTVADADDDGNAASQPAPAKKAAPAAAPKKLPPPDKPSAKPPVSRTEDGPMDELVCKHLCDQIEQAPTLDALRDLWMSADAVDLQRRGPTEWATYAVTAKERRKAELQPAAEAKS